jgi:hypothetical protein
MYKPIVDTGLVLAEIRERRGTIEACYAKCVRQSQIDRLRTSAFLRGYLVALDDVLNRMEGADWKAATALKAVLAQMERTGV